MLEVMVFPIIILELSAFHGSKIARNYHRNIETSRIVDAAEDGNRGEKGIRITFKNMIF